MTKNLMWLMYLADALSSLKTLAIMVFIGVSLGLSMFLLFRYVDDKKLIFPRAVMWALLAAAAAATFAPSRQTIYAAAAIYVAGEAAGTEEMQLVRKIITNELREMAEGRKDK